ncbi:MAG: hypothetical protein F6K00_15095 [Leptolyngbya sp. SIOISBB]|nr:hypothetical protein [Leptolyngbya sp. SIOISBB]
MTAKMLAKRLRKALLENGEMAEALYEYELQENLDYWYKGLLRDQDDYVFIVTENSGDVAMVIITTDKIIYVNERARDKLMELWPAYYAQNIEQLIPAMVQDLAGGHFFETGVKTVDNTKQKGPKKSGRWKT